MSHSLTLSMLLLLLCFFTDDIQAEEIVNGTQGKNITIRFTFEGKLNKSLTVKYANLHKNESKIEDSISSPVDNRRNFTLISHEPTLRISNLSTTDTGEYYVSLFYNELIETPIESKKTFLNIQLEEHITVLPPTGRDPSKIPPPGSLVYIPIITGIVVGIMMLSTVLLGWQYLTHNKIRDGPLPHQEQSPQGSSPKRQVKREVSCSVEYNVLDFHKKPGGKEGDRGSSPPPQPQETVEYSTIIFFHGPHGAGGAVPPPRGQ
ncbi:hypothetical protein SKAU_G00195660 [Synaphobranchus kaupii]|uniref:Immunoglobulin V-set domain-containing protein n=1 Tax=Synaphobranchus kaupii TaxID=118154 RepID=A0A9Q1FEH1_SYNKA|nr:hypothetical protein SKAU_G00195660 [Synaphobranchus kaupii]